MKGEKGLLTRETFRFFKDLGLNNRKEWMHENKDRYISSVVLPLRRLLEALTPGVKGLNPGFETSGKTGQNFSRINRDIRFTKDKSPYRTQMYLMFSVPEPKGQEAGQLYVGVSPDVVTAGFRIYGDRRKGPLAEMARPRACGNSRWLAAQARKLGKRYESYWHAKERREWVKHDGWPLSAADWEELEGWIVRRKMKPADAAKPGFPDEVQKVFKDLIPLWRMTSAKGWRA